MRLSRTGRSRDPAFLAVCRSRSGIASFRGAFSAFSSGVNPVVIEECTAASSKMLDPDPTIVGATFPFRSHAPQSHSKPSVKFPKLLHTRREQGPKESCNSADDRIDFLDFLAIQVVAASC